MTSVCIAHCYRVGTYLTKNVCLLCGAWWLSERAQVRIPFATASKFGHFRSPQRPSSFSCINEYLAIDAGGNVSDLVFARNCCLARMLRREVELVLE